VTWNCSPCTGRPAAEDRQGQRDEEPALGARFQARSIPLLVVLRDGREVDRIVGALPRPALEARLALCSPARPTDWPCDEPQLPATERNHEGGGRRLKRRRPRRCAAA
jgi:hypothetical protein